MGKKFREVFIAGCIVFLFLVGVYLMAEGYIDMGVAVILCNGFTGYNALCNVFVNRRR